MLHRRIPLAVLKPYHTRLKTSPFSVAQANTACGIETEELLEMKESYEVTQANTACGIETRKHGEYGCQNSVTQANTACGIETRTTETRLGTPCVTQANTACGIETAGVFDQSSLGRSYTGEYRLRY